MSTFGIFFMNLFGDKVNSSLLRPLDGRPEVLTLGILTVGQAYQEECEIYKASIVLLGKLGKGYIIRGILVEGDIRHSRLGIIR